MKRRGVTLVELLVGLGLAAVAFAVIYEVMHLFFGSNSRNNVAGITKRSFVQKDAKVGLRRLIYRLRESIQVLDPAPGKGGPELIIRDITNQRIRIRRDAAQSRMISEKFNGTAWELETTPTLLAAGTAGMLPASFPVYMASCSDLFFTVLTPECVAVEATLISDGQAGTMTTVIKLRNAGLGY